MEAKCGLTLPHQLFGLVPGGGVEPPRPEGRRILSPLRLPVPPSRLEGGSNKVSIFGSLILQRITAKTA
jgi:hypothetical protein